MQQIRNESLAERSRVCISACSTPPVDAVDSELGRVLVGWWWAEDVNWEWV